MSLVDKYVPIFVERARNAEPAFNDAQEKYGVEIEPVSDPGGPHWSVIGVHHLTGPENGGKHNIYCDALDEDGLRIQGSHLIATKGDLPSFLVKIDKPPQEPGTNFPMFKHDVATVAVHRPDETPLPSEKVINLHTGHPDEEPGNTLFHHSFFVVFQKTSGAAPPPVQTLEKTLWAEGEPLLIPLDRDSELFQFAQTHSLGERLTRLYLVEHGGQTFAAQIFEGGLVFAPLGQWDKIKVIQPE